MTNSVLLNGMGQVNSQMGKNARWLAKCSCCLQKFSWKALTI